MAERSRRKIGCRLGLGLGVGLSVQSRRFEIVAPPPAIASPSEIADGHLGVDFTVPSTFDIVLDGAIPRIATLRSNVGPSRSFTQATVAKRPVYEAANDGARFDRPAAQVLSLTESSGLPAWDAGTFFCVTVDTLTTEQRWLFVVNTGSTARLRLMANSTGAGPNPLEVLAVGAPDLNLITSLTRPAGGLRCAMAWWDATGGRLLDDNNTAAEAPAYGGPGGLATYGNMHIGARHGTSTTTGFDGLIKQLYYWPRRLTATERTQLFRYARQRFGTALPSHPWMAVA